MMAAAAATLACFLFPEHVASQPPVGVTKEYKVKLAYLYNFTMYINWPDHAFEKPKSPFVIGVLGNNPFGKGLLSQLEKRQCGGRPIRVRQFKPGDQLSDAHVLFISANHSKQNVDWLLAGPLKTAPTLVVCDWPGHALKGAPISFYLAQNGTVGFELNVDAIARRELAAKAKLLAIAKVVRDQKVAK